MALTYQTEYHLGRRGRVTRTYGGVRALVAISADLTLAAIFGAFGLVFGLIGWTLWLTWRLCRLVVLAIRELILALARFLGDVITLPWRVARRLQASRASKPVLASFDEL
jgi:hypothetical protein